MGARRRAGAIRRAAVGAEPRGAVRAVREQLHGARREAALGRVKLRQRRRLLEERFDPLIEAASTAIILPRSRALLARAKRPDAAVRVAVRVAYP